ncbi:hypothetical protein Q3G72_024896 [Acer saccharum]|nr:hypothetical protein Q3G72_016467 [Acer saccharum]KAK1563258.1 hypothetical protein Q3G72_024896 [Acer saccharum]
MEQRNISERLLQRSRHYNEIVTNIPSLPRHFFVFTNDFKFVGGGGFSDSSSSSASPIRRRRPLFDSSPSTIMVGLVGLSSDSEKETNPPNSKVR